MPNIYITDETKELLEKVSQKDKRTQDGEINFLLSERASQLGIVPVQPPSVKDNKAIKSDCNCQENKSGQ